MATMCGVVHVGKYNLICQGQETHNNRRGGTPTFKGPRLLPALHAGLENVHMVQILYVAKFLTHMYKLLNIERFIYSSKSFRCITKMLHFNCPYSGGYCTREGTPEALTTPTSTIILLHRTSPLPICNSTIHPLSPIPIFLSGILLNPNVCGTCTWSMLLT